MNTQIKIIMPRCFITFVAGLFLSFSLLAQRDYGFDSISHSTSQKPVVDYYERMDDKSFYQQKRIHSMKGELNDYSEKLHNLQDRFDRIFYGLSNRDSFKTPFDTSNQPQRPIYEPRPYDSATIEEVGSDTLIDNPIQPQSSQNKLAFNVDSPGKFKKDDQVVSTFNPNSVKASTYYLIIRPGFAIPHKIHKTTSAYKRYEPGFSSIISAGLSINQFTIGSGFAYKTHSFHNSSKLRRPHTLLNGRSETFAGFLDLSYSVPLAGRMEGYFGGSLGYYLTQTEDNKDLSKRKSHDVYLSANTGLKFRFSEIFALSLGYRYFHEEETPVHICELGLNFDF